MVVLQTALAQAASGRQLIDDASAWPELGLEQNVYGKVNVSGFLSIAQVLEHASHHHGLLEYPAVLCR